MNSHGQLGDGTHANSNMPLAITSSGVLAGKDIADIAGGYNHSLALSSEGEIYSWGRNESGQLGNGMTLEGALPVAVNRSGVLAGKTVTAIAAGMYHSLALCSDGRVYSWGNGEDGELGNGTTTGSSLPVAVNMSGALAGKTITAIDAGGHNLALSSDGRVYSWGQGDYGQLGNGTTTGSNVPVAVEAGGALAGKTVTAIAAGISHSLALTSDGKVYSWGDNQVGQLGVEAGMLSNVPVAVNMGGALAGKTVVAIAAGYWHSLVLTSDGRMYSWGGGGNGVLGSGIMAGRAPAPAAVVMADSLAGKTVTAIAANGAHNLVLTSEGRIYSWGDGEYGQLGNGADEDCATAVPVDVSDVLAGKRATAIAVGGGHSLALAFTPPPPQQLIESTQFPIGDWGGYSFQVPVDAGHRAIFKITSGSYSDSITLVRPDGSSVDHWTPEPGVTYDFETSTITIEDPMPGLWTVEVYTQITDSDHATVIASIGNDLSLDASFNKPVYAGGDKPIATAVLHENGQAVTGAAVIVTGKNAKGASFSQTLYDDGAHDDGAANDGMYTGQISAPLTGLYQVRFQANGMTAAAQNFQRVALTTLSVTDEAPQISYIADQTILEDHATSALEFVVTDPGISPDELTVSGSSSNPDLIPDSNIVFGGSGSNRTITMTPLADQAGTAAITIRVSDGEQWRARTFNLTVTAVNDKPIISDIADRTTGQGASTGPIAFIVNDADNDTAGLTVSAVSSNTALVPDANISLSGSGANRTIAVTPTAGQTGVATLTVTVSDGSLSASDSFVLVVVSKPAVIPPVTGTAYGWGRNTDGQLGIGTNSPSVTVPIAVDTSGALAGKSVVAVSAGTQHSLALTSEGRVYSWGYNQYGQLGNGSNSGSNVPVAVDVSGALAGKTVIAISAGAQHSLALTSEGQVYSWGRNNYGQLGGGSTGGNSFAPMAVVRSGALAGKTITAIAAGGVHSLALTSEGRIYSWGDDSVGELGNGAGGSSASPVAVDTSGNLGSETVVAIAAGSLHSLALTSNRRLYSWGHGYFGQLGLGGSGNGTDAQVPSMIGMSGELAGKTVVSIAAGESHSLVLTSDGRLYSWGDGIQGALGNGANQIHPLPTAVNMTNALAQKTVVAIAAGGGHSFALASDGRLYGWGYNASGQLGNGTATGSNVPIATDSSNELSGKIVTAISAGGEHNLAIASLAPTAPRPVQTIENRQISLAQNVALNIPIPIDSGDQAVFKVSTASTCNVRVRKPNGSIENPATTDLGLSYATGIENGLRWYSYTVTRPMTGDWDILISPSVVPGDDQSATVLATISNELHLEGVVGSTSYDAGATPFLTAVLTNNGGPVGGTNAPSVIATGVNAAGDTFTQPMYDDGAHGDGAANDGVYAAQVAPLAAPGVYNVRIQAGGLFAASQSFQRVALNSFSYANTAPTVSAFANHSTAPGVSTGPIAFTVSDAENAPDSLTVSSASSNLALVPESNILLSGAGANRTVTITPAANQQGTSNITITVSDGLLSTSRTFLLTVTPASTDATPPSVSVGFPAHGVILR